MYRIEKLIYLLKNINIRPLQSLLSHLKIYKEINKQPSVALSHLKR